MSIQEIKEVVCDILDQNWEILVKEKKKKIDSLNK
jgi:hypothetical protein